MLSIQYTQALRIGVPRDDMLSVVASEAKQSRIRLFPKDGFFYSSYLESLRVQSRSLLRICHSKEESRMDARLHGHDISV